jgi:N-acetylneuraminic acid mutarotase
MTVKNMKISLSTLFLFIALILAGTSCQDSEDDDDSTAGNWVRSTPFKGSRRSGAVVFTIDNKAYVGLGYNGDTYFTDLYEYDISLGFWKTKASFTGVPRERAVAFSLNGKAYIGLGYNRDEDKEELRDFWEYDPAADTWTQMNDFGGSARYNAVAFAIDNKGYVGTGNDGANYNGDFWEYDPADDSWTEIISYPGNKREEATAFVLEGKAYLCTGRNNGVTDIDFWQFDAEAKTWTNKIPDDDEDYYTEFSNAVHRYGAVSFTLNGMGYIATGINSSGSVDNTVWQYNPTTEEWVTMTSFEGSSRSQSVAFYLDSRVFVGTGQSGSSRFDDIWEFRPGEEYNEND